MEKENDISLSSLLLSVYQRGGISLTGKKTPQRSGILLPSREEPPGNEVCSLLPLLLSLSPSNTSIQTDLIKKRREKGSRLSSFLLVFLPPILPKKRNLSFSLRDLPSPPHFPIQLVQPSLHLRRNFSLDRLKRGERDLVRKGEEERATTTCCSTTTTTSFFSCSTSSLLSFFTFPHRLVRQAKLSRKEEKASASPPRPFFLFPLF